MKEIAGFVRFDGDSIDDRIVSRLRRAVASTAPAAVWRPDPAGIFVEGRDRDDPVPAQRHPDRVLLVDAAIDNRAELARELGLAKAPASRELCVAACGRWGISRAIERLYGDVALVEWEIDRRRLTISRGPMGARPVFYVETPRFVIFASSLQLLLTMPEVSREIDEVILAHTLTLALRDPETTLYRQVRRVPPGTTMVFENGRRTMSRWYDAASIKPVRLGSDDAYVEAARERLDAAVASRLPPSGRVAAQLSGGFDSGGVVATAARQLGATGLDAYTRVASGPSPDDDFDEEHLAGLLVARYPAINWRVLSGASEPDREPEQEAGATMVPSAATYNAGWFRSMRRTIEASSPAVLLTGVLGNYTLSFRGSPSLASSLRKGRVDRMLRDVRGLARQRSCSTAQAALSAAYHELVPGRLRRWRSHRMRGDRPWLTYCLASPDFLDSLDYAAHARQVEHELPFQGELGSAAMRLRLIQDQGPTDFRGVAVRKWSVPVAQPYRDRRLVEFCLGIPADQYWRDGQGRWLARRVLADRLPAETLAQVRTGRQAPEWHHLGTQKLDVMAAAVDRIARSPLASRVLDVPRMRALLDSWPKDAESAEKTRLLHGHALARGIAMGGFLRWIEGRND